LYELIFKGYMLKQVTARIPIRNDWDDWCFPNDKYQVLPSEGYTKVFENMIGSNEKIDVFSNTDFFEVRDRLNCGTM
jgi:UDP-galactopyranose mutase